MIKDVPTLEEEIMEELEFYHWNYEDASSMKIARIIIDKVIARKGEQYE